MKAQRRLVVASCGNAGLAAATIAAAAEWPIDVCIPDNADPSVVANLQSLGKTVNIVFCPRDVDEVQVGDVGMVSTAGAADPTVSWRSNGCTHRGIEMYLVWCPQIYSCPHP